MAMLTREGTTDELVKAILERELDAAIGRLKVSVCGSNVETQESIRVLVDKTSTFVGVLAACEQVSEGRPVATPPPPPHPPAAPAS